MTRRPTDEVPLGIDGPPYPLNVICAHPTCAEKALDTHHIWRRSLLGAPYSWVMLGDGSQVGNVVRLCRSHHAQVTDDRAQIAWEGLHMVWLVDGAEILPLSYQPPFILGEVQFENAGEKIRVRRVRENECPSCGQALPHTKVERPKEAKRVRRTWSITVPVDARENGAETLDTLLEEARSELDKAGLSYGDERSTRFFVLAAVLGLFVHHFDELVDSGE